MQRWYDDKWFKLEWKELRERSFHLLKTNRHLIGRLVLSSVWIAQEEKWEGNDDKGLWWWPTKFPGGNNSLTSRRSWAHVICIGIRVRACDYRWLIETGFVLEWQRVRGRLSYHLELHISGQTRLFWTILRMQSVGQKI